MSQNPTDDHAKMEAAKKGQDELTFLEKKYGVPRSTIEAAVKVVGRDPEKVEKYLTTRSE